MLYLSSLFNCKPSWTDACVDDLIEDGPSLARSHYIHQKVIIIIVNFDRRLFDHFDHVVSQKKEDTIQGIGNGELMYECFPKHSLMGTARMK